MRRVQTFDCYFAMSVLWLMCASFQPVEAQDHLPASTQPSYSVVWNSLGKDHRDSMPIGNGDVGANVWTEQNGDLVLLIGKTDAWSENGQLLKIGEVRLRLSPNPFIDAPQFRQILNVREGIIHIDSGGGAAIDVWIDANRPVIHVEYKSSKPLSSQASVELWRTGPRTLLASSYEAKTALRDISRASGVIQLEADTVLPARSNSLRWAHNDERSIYPEVFKNQHLEALLPQYPDPLLHRIFGALLKGPNLVSSGDQNLSSGHPATEGRADIYVLTEHPSTLADWVRDLDKLVAGIDAVPLAQARREHERWWEDFWSRSWINVSGSSDAEAVSQGYVMQRWLVAAAGRGPMPMKFNGSIFTTGDNTTDGDLRGRVYDPAKGQIDPDFRMWGSNYWFQNQRLIYWPLLASGDLDLMQPFFAMYRKDLPLETDINQVYYRHAGARYPETMYFWGTPNNVDFGWDNPDVVMTNGYVRNHIDGGLELTMMMLDAYGETRDDAFARTTLLPIADAVTTYFDRHWTRVNGKILFDPSQSLETDRPAVNPAPDVAGLHAVLPRLIALPIRLTTGPQRGRWKRMLEDLPPLPRGRTNKDGRHPEPDSNADPNGKEILLTADRWTPGPDGKAGNIENPELYSVFPYRLFGVGLPDLQLARDTFAARRFPGTTCWAQDGMDAADLGLADEARLHVVANFTDYGVEKFRWFWAKGHDGEPDLDNGGAGMSILQMMLMQIRGNKILLLPAWPRDWNVDFKLHAPQNTTIQGSYSNGHLHALRVFPESRAKDIVQMTPQ